MGKKKHGETSYKETSFGIIPRSKLILLEIEGVKRAWNFILQEYAKDKISPSIDFLKKIHAIGFGWIFPEMGGKFRSIDVEVSNHEPPHFYKVPQLMLDFCRDLEERLRHLPDVDNKNFVNELIDLLAWAHHRFLWIHPFQDYNGRIGRLLINIILLNLGLPPIELKIETRTRRHKYVEALDKADHGDYQPLEDIIKHALEEATKEL